MPMLFETKCLTKILDQANRQEALNDYASLISDLGYDAEMAVLYSSCIQTEDKEPVTLTATELNGATVSPGHGCAYIQGRYGNSMCDSCSMNGRRDTCYIRADASGVTEKNIRDIKKEQAKAFVPEPEGKPAESNRECVKKTAPQLKDDKEAELRERRLLVHILSQTPARVKTMLPSSAAERERIRDLFVSRINIAAESGKSRYETLYASIYEVLFICANNKIIGSSTCIAKSLPANRFMPQLALRYKDMVTEETESAISNVYEALRRDALVYADTYSGYSEWDRRKAREEAFAYFKGDSKKKSKPSMKEMYSENLSVLDLLTEENNMVSIGEELADDDGGIVLYGTSSVSGQQEAEPALQDFDLDALDRADRRFMEMDASHASSPDTPVSEEQKQEEQKPEEQKPEEQPAVNPHATITPSALLDEWMTGFSACKNGAGKTGRQQDANNSGSSQEGKVETSETSSAKQSRKKKASKETEVKTEKPEEAVLEPDSPTFEYKEQKLTDTLFADVDWDIAEASKCPDIPAKEEETSNETPADKLVRDSSNGKYSFEVKVTRDWLKDNGFVSLDDITAGEASRKIMYSFMKSTATGVEVVRTEEDGIFRFLLFFGDIGERYSIDADSKTVLTTLKHYLSNDSLYKKVSECPIAVFAKCADLGFMAENLSYVGGFTRPYGAYAPSPVIAEQGFKEYAEENWKKTRASRTEAKQLYFEKALSRSLYLNGRTFPFIEIENGSYVFLNMVRERKEKIIVRPQIIDDVKEDDFRRFTDDTIRKLEENNVLYKYRARIVSLDYAKRELAFAVYAEDYRAFYTCLTRIQIRIFNRTFRDADVRPTLGYSSERYEAKKEA